MGEEPYHTTAPQLKGNTNRETSDLNGSLGVLIRYVNVHRSAYIQPALANLHLSTGRVPTVTKSAPAIDLVRVCHDVGAVLEFS
jgi:hypothetical protein